MNIKRLKIIRDDFNSQFPTEYKLIRELRGVGDYTAAAISSFCFKEKKAVLDGNVYRLLSRFFGIETPIDSSNGKKEFSDINETKVHRNSFQKIKKIFKKKYPKLSIELKIISLNSKVETFR